MKEGASQAATKTRAITAGPAKEPLQATTGVPIMTEVLQVTAHHRITARQEALQEDSVVVAAETAAVEEEDKEEV